MKCDICKQEKKTLRSISNELNVCNSCYKKSYAPRRLCSECGIVGTIEMISNGKDICGQCYRKYYRPKSICSICGNEAIICKKDNGRPICSSCYEKHFRPKGLCSICGKYTKISKYSDNQVLCKSCYRKYLAPKKKCSICGETRVIEKKDESERLICSSCYHKQFKPRRTCSVCNEDKPIAKTINSKDICKSCYNKLYIPKRQCFICKKYSVAAKKTAEGFVCKNCYKQHYQRREVCSSCGKENIIQKNLSGKAICPLCYNKYFQPTKICSCCKQEKPISAKIGEKYFCNTCYNKYEETCTNCGKKSKYFYHSQNICIDCWFKLKFSQLIVDSKTDILSTNIYQLWCDFADCIINNRKPYIAYSILSSYQKIFKYISNSNISPSELSYRYVEDLCNQFGNNDAFHLQNFLISKGFIVPPLPSEIFDKSRCMCLTKIDEKFKPIFIKYTNYLLLINQHTNDKGWNKRFTLQTCTKYSYIICNFLINLSLKITSINEITENHTSEFCSNNSYSVSVIRHFIVWLNRNYKLFKKLRMPKNNLHSSTLNIYSDSELFTIVESLSDFSTSLREKAMGFLILLYALRPFELRKLKLEDLKFDKANCYIYIRDRWTILHPLLADIIVKYIDIEHNTSLSFGSQTSWLFPGKYFQAPLSSDQICKLLKKHNIKSMKSFSTTIINSFTLSDTTPSTLIVGLGINLKTIMNYHKSLNIINASVVQQSRVELLSGSTKETKNLYYIYILKCIDGSYYTGYTSDLQKRLQQHQNGTGCTYTKTRTPVELVYSEELPDKPSALKREKQIKKLTIFDKEKLIEKSREN